MFNEGFTKYKCEQIEENFNLPRKTFKSLTKWREILFRSDLIGAYADGVGYGNLSVRATDNSFYISGTGTGRLTELEEKHYALVSSWSLTKNSLKYRGSIKPSAESLSHAAIYESLAEVGAAIHIHNKKMWDKYINRLLTTSGDALFGTPEMAEEIKRIVLTKKPDHDPIIVMGGHEEGLIAWGETLDDAGGTILKYSK